MYVCICHAVADSQVHAAVDAGALSVDAVGDATRAGTGCGMCHDVIDDIIETRCRACPLADALSGARVA